MQILPDEITEPPLPRPVATVAATLFGGIARLRSRRALHPRGTVHAGTLQAGADERLPARWRALDGYPAVLRFSRGGGLPAPLPDVLGVAVRVGGQDLLCSSADRLLYRVPQPSRSPTRCTFSSLAPYRAGSLLGLVTAVLDGGALRVELRDRTGVVHLATVTVGERLRGDAERVRFDPFRVGGDLVPVGFVHRLRPPAYAASRAHSPR